MNADVAAYHEALEPGDRAIADLLFTEISNSLPQAVNKVWHRHPVWFIDGNPIAGYHRLKDSLRLMFWSGQSFGEPGLAPEGSFKAAEVRYTDVAQINTGDLHRWLQKAVEIQWDYKNIAKRKGQLERLA
jgi:hypothetical protein